MTGLAPGTYTHSLSVANLAESLADEAELIGEVVEAAWARAASRGGLDASSVAGAPPALARLLVYRRLFSFDLAGARVRIFAGLSLEAGNVYFAGDSVT